RIGRLEVPAEPHPGMEGLFCVNASSDWDWKCQSGSDISSPSRGSIAASAESRPDLHRFHNHASRQAGFLTACLLFLNLFFCSRPAPAFAQEQGSVLYRRADVPIEQRLDDLLGSMTLEEKVRQLDMYSGATGIMSPGSDATHAAPGAVFVPEKAQQLWGELGVGSIHDL